MGLATSIEHAAKKHSQILIQLLPKSVGSLSLSLLGTGTRARRVPGTTALTHEWIGSKASTGL